METSRFSGPQAAAASDAGIPLIALISPSGHGNLGDEAILASVIENIRVRRPAARFVGLTLSPEDTRRRFGIDAFPIAGASRPNYLVRADAPVAHGGAAPRKRLLHQVRAGIGRFAREALKHIVPKKPARAALHEMRHLRAAYRLMRDIDLVIVAGGGQLDDFWGGTWGQPLALFKWACLAHLRGKRVVVASVGCGSLRTRTSRWLARGALRLASYRSFRDERSLHRMRQAGMAGEADVVPDLVFALERSRLIAESRHPSGAQVFCISPMVYLDPLTWPVKDEAAHHAYLDRLADVAAELLGAGCRVVLAASDGPDQRCVDALWTRLSERVPEAALERLSAPDTDSVDRFLSVVAGADVLVASRMHGLALSLLAATPVLALSYDPKVDALMQAFDSSEECLGIDDFDPQDVLRRALRTAADSARLRPRLAAQVRASAQQLQPQFDRMLG